ncbi:efflux RND transporter periplasmic adaptor subunit [Chloroflexota bacterium]
MKYWSIVMVLVLCLVLVGSMACNPFTGNGEVAGQQLVEVVRGDLVVTVSGSGNIDVSNEVKLTFGTTGKVAEINVNEGDRVTEGQLLAKLDITTLERAVKTAEQAVKTAEQAVVTVEIAVSAAEINLELANNSYQQLVTPYPFRTYEFAIPESLNDIRVAQQRIKEAQDEFQNGLQGERYSMARIQEQLAQAKESLVDAETKLDWGLSSGIRPSGLDYWTLRTAQMQVEQAQLALASAENEVNSAKNGVDAANNELDMVSDELEKAVILAPFDGIIAKVDIKSGDFLSSVNYVTTASIHLIDLTSMELKAEVDEIDISGVRLGQRVIIDIEGLSEVQYEGEVTSISPLAREEVGLVLYEVKIGFDVPEGSGIMVGMSATSNIVINERSNVLLLPNQAVTSDNQGNPVVKAVVNGQIEDKLVVLGTSDGVNTEVLDKLDEGDIVVVRE